MLIEVSVSYMADDYLNHSGVKRRSGRYPWGSGSDPYQHEANMGKMSRTGGCAWHGESSSNPPRFRSSEEFLDEVNKLKKDGYSDSQIIKKLDLESSVQYRASVSVAKANRRRISVETAKKLKEEGLGASEIGRRMGVNESTVRSWLNSKSEENMNQAMNTAEKLKEEIAGKKALDVGKGVELSLGVSPQKLDEALYMLQAEGYTVVGVGIPQATEVNISKKGNLYSSGKQTTVKVLLPPGTPYSEAYALRDNNEISHVGEFHSIDNGKTFFKRQYPQSIDSNRVSIAYAEDGGVKKDGVIELRRGVADLDLGASHYAQVRILVDGTHYLKGMAIYSDDLPPGTDIRFNTNKHKGTPKLDVLKPISHDDPNNPFNAYIKADGQSEYIGKDGKKHLSAINKLKEEGDWDTMSRTLSSQFLSKQPKKLIDQQLKLTYIDLESQLEDIQKFPNPTIRKQLLNEFANKCDSKARDLKAIALPRQTNKVILPVDAMKDNEVYAPDFKNGEKVVLIRYPHGGVFEIPELVVNNKNKKAEKILGNAQDAIGINTTVAAQLSGADFDGDSVTIIPVNGKVKIKTSPPLESLKGFEPKDSYPYKPGVKVMKKSMKQQEMGVISNLITDMTLQDATPDEIARAVRHSMVVIDACKHKLDYKQSYIDNDISELKKKYQPKYDSEGNVVGGGGATTLISKHKQTVSVPETKGSPYIDKQTGELKYKNSGRTYLDEKGNTVEAKTKRYLINETKDVRTLSSGTPQENAYADFSNKVKSLANRARKEMISTKDIEYNPSAKKVYSAEVESLNSKLNIAMQNAPKERAAQQKANSIIKKLYSENPDMEKSDIKKIAQQYLERSRDEMGASGRESRINITDREWEAIQAGAVSPTKVKNVLKYTDSEKIKERAIPRSMSKVSDIQISKIKAMDSSGYTISEIAETLGVSTSTVSRNL